MSPELSPDLPTLQAQIARLESALAQARAELDDYTYAVSHDLRAPLRHVSAYVRVLREDFATGMAPEARAHLDTIEQAALGLARQIEALTTLSRLARQDLHWGEVDLGALMHELRVSCEASLRDHAPVRAVQWVWPSVWPVLQGDASLLRVLFAQALDNALKFSATRALAVLELTWEPLDAARCRITLVDNGSGFAPAQAKQLFRPFARAHAERDVPGMGMGMVTVRKIAQRHGGVVSIQGLEQAGCRLTLELPWAGADVRQTCCDAG